MVPIAAVQTREEPIAKPATGAGFFVFPVKLKQGAAVDNQTGHVCSLCGSRGNLTGRFVSCGSKAKFQTTSPDGKNNQTIETADELVLWRVWLCPRCLWENYYQYLEERLFSTARDLRNAGKAALIALGCILLAMFILAVNGGPQSSYVFSGLLNILLAFLGVVFLGMLVWLPFLYFNRISFQRQLVRYDASTPEPLNAKQVTGTFKAVGRIILECQEQGSGTILHGDFPLPVYREHASKPDSLNSVTLLSTWREVLEAGVTGDVTIPYNWKHVPVRRAGL